MEILFATTELAPFVKVGGLADVAAALPKALRSLGHRVTVVLPRYSGDMSLDASGLLLARRLTPLKFELGDRTIEATVYDARLPSQVELVVLDIPGLLDRPGVYGPSEGEGAGEDYADNALRFSAFSRAVAEVALARAKSGTPFDILHANDWPTALAGAYLRDLAKTNEQLSTTKIVLTLHNVGHQGVFPKELLPALGMSWDAFSVDGIEFYGKLNFLKHGILNADRVTTVSPTYAREIQTPEHGGKLEGLLKSRSGSLVGILNGVDSAVWNPATDPMIAARYDAEDTVPRARCGAELCSASSVCRSIRRRRSSPASGASWSKRGRILWPRRSRSCFVTPKRRS